MAKLFVILARCEPTAVILRRGPSDWYHVIQWNTQRDFFVHGAWIKGRIYENKCDISPDGRLLLYFIHQGSRIGTEFTDSWTAISRVPWLQALAVWPQGTTYGGGGRFIDDSTIALRNNLELPSFGLMPTRIKLVDAATPLHQPTNDVPGADWCGRDHGNHVIYSQSGRLFRRIEGMDKLIADFTELKPNPQPAPGWASRSL